MATSGNPRLEGQRALVTGGTRGIGLAIARRFGQEGAAVVIAGTIAGSGEEVAGQLRSEGLKAHFESVDMADARSVQEMVGRAALHLHGIDVLVNSAGVAQPTLLRKLQEAQWDNTLNTNLKGAVFCMKAVHGVMAQEHIRGSMINISSIAGADGDFGLAAYAASKAGLEAVTRVAAREFARDGIRVNAVAPGVIETDMTSVLPDVQKQAIAARVPLGHLGQPEDIAGLCMFLATDDAAYITGQVLRVDGGLKF